MARRTVLLGAAVTAAGVAGGAAPDAGAASAPSVSRTQTVAAFPSARDVARDRTYQSLSASDLHPSGFHLPADTVLTVEVAAATAETCRLVVGAPDAEADEAKRDPREYDLDVGENVVKDPYGGPLYWKAIGASGRLEATVGESAQRMPCFAHGTTTEGEFQDQLVSRGTPFVELVSAHALVTVQREAALRFRGEDHARLMATFEDLIAIEDAFAGLDGATAVDARLDNRYHFVTRPERIEGVGALATHGHMVFPAPIQDRLLTVEGLRMRGWGIYHELGHQHQQTVYRPTALGESTVNWYSLAVNRAFGVKYGQAPRLHTPESNGETVWTSAPAKIGSRSVDFLTSFTPMEQLVMYEQLRLAYGTDLFPDVHRLVRAEKPNPGDYWDSGYRLGMLVLYLSKAAGEDLREFAAQWGIAYDSAFDAKIDALGLPEPAKDLTKIRDDEGAARMADIRSSASLREANRME
ncbi:M60 family metallopeptidase [Brachybacterium sp. ACRRE]|nr:M60 family metallopeptidase [Brachybacterium sp. ACRRE]